jgi:peptidyl-tRNA hydrolase
MDLGDGIPAEARIDSGLKLYAVFSPVALKAMKGVRGKLAAQAGHAYLHAWWDAARRKEVIGDVAFEYQRSLRAYKIALVAPEAADEAWFDGLIALYRGKTGVTKVVDAGLTVFDGPTLTCIGIGPIHPDNREDILRGLKSLT